MMITLVEQIAKEQEFCYIGDVRVQVWGGESWDSKGKCSIEKMEGYGEFADKKKVPLMTSGSVYENCIRSVMLCGTKTQAVVQRDEDVIKKCDKRMLRCMVEAKCKDRISSKEVSNR